MRGERAKIKKACLKGILNQCFRNDATTEFTSHSLRRCEIYLAFETDSFYKDSCKN